MVDQHHTEPVDAATPAAEPEDAGYYRGPNTARTVVIGFVVLVVAFVLYMALGMPGMDHGGDGMDPNMPGMDHG
jgi:hypothetical protein